MILGRHMSRAACIKDAKALDINAVQVFVKSPQIWACPALPSKPTDFGNLYVCAHASYLINLGKDSVESRQGLVREARLCKAIGIKDLVVHPGSGTVEWCIENLNRCAPYWPEGVRLLIENTAGQGNYIGGDMIDVMIIVTALEDDLDIGICFDTAHAWQYGLDPLEYLDTPEIKVFHVNDSLTPKSSHKDRHANIGYGTMPIDIFEALAQIKDVPLIMETPELHAEKDIKIFRRMAR